MVSSFSFLSFSFLYRSSESFLSLCTGLWARPCCGSFIAGHHWFCMVCCCATRSPPAPCHWHVFCACVPCFWQQCGDAETHASSTLWPGLPKEPPPANPTFNLKSSLLILHLILTVCHAERSEWSHICLEFLFCFLHRYVQYYSYQHWFKLFI